MKRSQTSKRIGGFTMWDLLILVFAVLLVLFVLPSLMVTRKSARVSRIQCISNIKQMGLAFRMWAEDHEDKFPPTVSTNDGGTMEYTQTRETFRHLLVLSDELVSPKILYCPSDKARKKTGDWAAFDNSTLSYAIGLDVQEDAPNSLLLSDRNITGGGKGTVRAWNDSGRVEAGWDKTIHEEQGNIGFADGSASMATSSSLAQGIRAVLTNDLNDLKRVRLQLP